MAKRNEDNQYKLDPMNRASGTCESCGQSGPIGYPDDTMRVLHTDVAGRLYCCECWEEAQND